jgi:3-methyladenine DNA glycosylase/8-oxoguanine DNA glycosylase
MERTRAIELTARQPYCFAFARTYFTRRAGELVDRVEEGVYRRLLALPSGTALIDVAEIGERLILSLQSCDRNADSRRLLDEAAAVLTRTLGLDDDVAAIEANLARDPKLAPLVHRQSGLRLISTPTPFEALVWAVVGQQISLLVAFRLKAALVRAFGRRACFAGLAYYAFPEPGTLAVAGADALAALGLGQRKAQTIVTIAGLVANGELDLDALATAPLAEAATVLTALHGIGPWTAHYALMRGLRRLDACPVSDMGLRVACGEVYGLGRKASVEEVAALAQGWGPYRGYAATHLWFLLADRARLPS